MDMFLENLKLVMKSTNVETLLVYDDGSGHFEDRDGRRLDRANNDVIIDDFNNFEELGETVTKVANTIREKNKIKVRDLVKITSIATEHLGANAIVLVEAKAEYDHCKIYCLGCHSTIWVHTSCLTKVDEQ